VSPRPAARAALVVSETAPRVLTAPLRIRLARGATPHLFILPKLVFFAVFMVLPLAWTILMTFQAGPILGSQRFVGVSNYTEILQDPIFWLSLRNSIYYAVVVIPLAIGGGIVLAGLLNRRIRLRPLFILLLIIPAVTSTVGAAVIWNYMLLTDGGLFNRILQVFGIEPVNWLGTIGFLVPIFIALELWRGTGFYAILFLAAMQSIPRYLYDAAAIDGATGVRAFRVVTLPLLRPAILFALVMATIWNLQIFDSPYVMTKGGPGYESMTVVMYIYLQAFRYDAMGLASTMSFFLLLLILTLAVLQLYAFRKEVQF
jgi:ABC-type sugar transport system permease subunit